jgi:glycosyltransferase 2 family protein
MKKLMTAAGIALSGLLLWLAVKDTDFGEISASFRDANGLLAVPLLFGLASFYILKAARWSDILAPMSRIRVRELIPSMMSGAAGNNLLPAHMGELVRSYLLGREYSLSKVGILASLVAERIFDIVGVLLLLSGTLLFAELSTSLRSAVVFLLIVAVAGSIFMYLVVRHADALQKAVLEGSGRFLPAIRRKAGALALHITSGFGAVRESRLLFRILASSIVLWLLMSACIYCALRAIGIDVPYHAAIVVLAIIVAGLTLPTSPGFVGTIQYCFVLGLGSYGVEPGKALAASLFYHALLWFSVTGTGLYFLYKQRLTFAGIRDLERQEALQGERGLPEERQ